MKVHKKGGVKARALKSKGGRNPLSRWTHLRQKLASVKSVESWVEVRLDEFGPKTTETQLRNAVYALNRSRRFCPPRGLSWGVSRDAWDAQLFRLVLGKRGRH